MADHPPIQQGDVLLHRIDSIPAGSMPLASRTIARGEHTGHSHTIEQAEGATLYTLDEILYLVAEHEATVVHQEHRPVTVPPGTYRIGRVREWDYTQHEARQVRD